MIGAKHTYIIAASGLEGASDCLYDGKPVTGLFPQLHAWMAENGGPGGASLFALPERGFSRTRQAEMVTWYTDKAGPFRSLDSFPQAQQQLAEQGLRTMLDKAVSASDGPMREMLSAALSITGTDSIFFDGETVVLANWGFRKADQDPSTSALAPYLPAGMSLVAPLEASPAEAISDEPTAVPPDPVDAIGEAKASESVGQTVFGAVHAKEVSPEQPGAARAAATAPALDAAAPVATTYPGLLTATWWLSGLALLLALFLFYLLWPGNLLYPGQGGNRSAANDAAVDGLQAQVESSLRNQIQELQAGLSGNICTAPNLNRLDSISNLPLLPGSPAAPAGRPDASPMTPAPTLAPATGSTPPQAQGDTPLAPAPLPRAVGEQGAALPSSTLVANLEAGTVIVVGAMTPQESSIGSGFFVSPRHILTNGHVVKGVRPGTIFIANKAISPPLAAKVLSSTTSSTTSGDDFALLEVDRDVGMSHLPIARVAERLDSVVASGYPSFVVNRDPNFHQAFSQGQWNHLGEIQLTVSRGEIIAKQSGQGGATVIAHSATISPGSSGGPLVDRCGRVVGINTYIRMDQESFARVNYAQSADAALQFLTRNGIAVTPAESACADPGTAPPAVASTPAAVTASDANPPAGAVTAVPRTTGARP